MNFTIVVQGRTDKDCLQKNIENFCGVPVIVSTWVGDSAACGENVIVNELPKKRGHGNFMLQLVSTIEGLKRVKTKYSIKVRGDEFYNYTRLMELVLKNENKIIVAPIFFRKMSYRNHRYHISDHLMAGKTDYLLNMFETAKLKYESTMSHDYCKEWGLTMAHMWNMGFDKFNDLSLGKEEMKKMFGIIAMDELKPYRVTANCYRRVFHNDFIPSQWDSIEDMDDL